MIAQQIIEISKLRKVKNFCNEQINLINETLQNNFLTSDIETEKAISKLEGMKVAFSDTIKMIDEREE